MAVGNSCSRHAYFCCVQCQGSIYVEEHGNMLLINLHCSTKHALQMDYNKIRTGVCKVALPILSTAPGTAKKKKKENDRSNFADLFSQWSPLHPNYGLTIFRTLRRQCKVTMTAADSACNKCEVLHSRTRSPFITPCDR